MTPRSILLAVSATGALAAAGFWLGHAASTPAAAPAPTVRSASLPAVAIAAPASVAAPAPAPVVPAVRAPAPDLLADLRDRDPKIRRAAIHELAGDRDADVQLLRDASRDHDLEVGGTATEALAAAYRDGRIEVGELVALARDAALDPKVRGVALNGLGRVPSPEAAALLADVAASGSPDDRASAVILLRNQELAQAAPVLIRALGDAEPRVRQLARDSLVSRARGRDFGEDRAAWQAWWDARR